MFCVAFVNLLYCDFYAVPTPKPPEPKKKKAKGGKRGRRKRSDSSDDESEEEGAATQYDDLEEGVEWYEEEKCFAPDCKRPRHKRVAWVCIV